MDASKLLKAKERDQDAIRTSDLKLIKKVFEENTVLLKEFIEENGWPSREKFGDDVCSAAWLIAQHSDHDPLFQLQCLLLIIANIDMNDKESMQDVAFLADRILINMKQKQVFGTQLNGNFTVPEVLDINNLNILREKFGLEPIEDYIERVKKFYEMKGE